MDETMKDDLQGYCVKRVTPIELIGPMARPALSPKITQGMGYTGYNHTLHTTDTRGICIRELQMCHRDYRLDQENDKDSHGEGTQGGNENRSGSR